MRTTVPVVSILFSGLVLHLATSCGNTNFGQRADSLFLVVDDQKHFYDLKKPNEKYFLPYVLEEISGISWKDGRILAVDDERGKVFEYDLSSREITHTMEFYKGDDFEGVEMVQEEIFVLRSDGDLFAFDYTSSKTTAARKIETALGKKNDTEGLGYDPASHQLLIACKEKGAIAESPIEGRAFYLFDLRKGQLLETPVFTIKPQDLKNFWELHRDFKYEEDRIKFKPAAISTHPISGDYYILSSVGKMIVVVNKSGKIRATYPIASRVLGQPEGLTFAPDGTMYISSEGEGDRAYILKFDMENR
ncbi:MAG: SdiA-regulated domain-containing protein [Bacteroidota bacterium]